MSLKKRYREAIQPKLLKDLNFTNMHQVPKVVNCLLYTSPSPRDV